VLSVVDKGLESGEVLVQRQFTGERLVCVRTARVVGHDEAGLRIWIPSGSPGLDWRAVDGRGIREMPFAEWISTPQMLAPRAWSGPDILMFFPAGAAHSVWWFWRQDGAFDCWYVNLEEPGVWWRDSDAAGIDVCDQDLDIVAAPDRSWRWKDEDELETWIARGVCAPETANRIRAEGLEVAGRAERDEPPFCEPWPEWRPEPSWELPELPYGWNERCL
jgi:Protein of unknown function (DUF402)